MTTDSGSPERPWPAQLTDSIGAQVKHYRRARKMSTQGLATELTAIGKPFGFKYSRDQIINLERTPGRRSSITVGEVLLFAFVLGVPPVQLIAPVGTDCELELLPGRTFDAWTAWSWFTGSNRDIVDPDYHYLINLYERHDKAVERLLKALPEGDVAIPLSSVISVRSQLRSKGWGLPQLPRPGAASADEGERLRDLVAEAEAAVEDDDL